MPLTPKQKKYLKRHIKKQSLGQIAFDLGLPEKEILNYLGRKWDKEKVSKYQATDSNSTPKTTITHFWQYLKKNKLIFLGLAILVILTYANALNNAFLSDDIVEIRDNVSLRSFSFVLSHPFGPIRPFLYWLVINLAGLQPWAFRLINYCFHLGSVWLVFIIVDSLYSKRKLAIFTASLFAVHPLLAEPIIWISGGSYEQYSFFFLISFLLYVLSDQKRHLWWLSIIFYFLSLLSHGVMAISLVAIFALYELTQGKLRTNWRRLLPFVGLALVFALVSIAYLPERVTTLKSVHYQQQGIDNPLLVIVAAISSYLQLLFWPQDLTLYHSELNFSASEFIIRALVVLAVLTILVVNLKKNKFIAFWLSFFLIALSPTLTPFRLNWIVAERYAYLGSIGIALLFSALIIYLVEKLKMRRLDYGLILLLVGLLAIRTFIRNIDWLNEDNLWLATGKTSPSSPNTHNNLGDMYGRHGDKQMAIKEFQKAIELKPNYADAYHNLGNTYHEMGKDDLALYNYQKAAEFNPNLWQSYQNIAAIYFAQKKYDLALTNMQKAIKVNPNNLQLYNNLGLIYLAKGDKNKAKEIFTQVLSSDPQNQFAQQGLLKAGK